MIKMFLFGNCKRHILKSNDNNENNAEKRKFGEGKGQINYFAVFQSELVCCRVSWIVCVCMAQDLNFLNWVALYGI